MFCKKCGASLSDGAMFCSKCGEKTDKPGLETAVSAAGAPSSGANDEAVSDADKTTRIPDNNVKNEASASVPGAAAGISFAVAPSAPPAAPVAPVKNRKNGVDITAENAALSLVWPDWKLVKLLGEGSFGKVFEAERNDAGTAFKSAIKIITVPKNDAELDSIRAEIGADEQAAALYFKTMVDDCVNEIKMMESFKGTANIVSVEDYKVVQRKDAIGWTIFIRMELLTSFTSFLGGRTMQEKDVIKLGIDMCTALECCASRSVMHRDIKPENIFISNFGAYKLGDFGIARQLEKSTTAMSRKGTVNYMAPEIYLGVGQYDFKSDIYSLGIMLYKLLNNNRLPFVNPRSATVDYTQLQSAFDRRMNGEKLPAPINASPALAAVILDACAFDPAQRIPGATALKHALIGVMNGAPNDATVNIQGSAPVNQSRPAVPAQPPVQVDSPAPAQPPVQPKQKKEKKKMSKGKKALIIIIAALVVILGVGGYIAIRILTSPEQKMKKALENGDYSEALDIAGEGDSKANDLLIADGRQKLEDAKNGFAAGTLGYGDAKAQIETVESWNLKELAEDVSAAYEYIDLINDSFTAYNAAETFFEKKDYAKAIENYEKVAEADAVHYADASEKVKTAKDEFRTQTLENAKKYAGEKLFDKAIAELENGLEVLPADSELTAQLEVYQKSLSDNNKSKQLKKAEEYAENGDYESAIKTLQTAIGDYPNDVDVKTDLQKYTDAYVDEVTQKVEEYTESRNYNDAAALIDAAIKLLPDNEELKRLKEDCDKNKPTAINTFTPINGNFPGWNEGTPADPFGVTHTDNCNYIIFSNYTYYNEYRLYGKYKTLTGKLVPHSDIPEDGHCSIKIYADDELVYTSEDIGRKTDVISFSADINYADYVKIETVCNTKNKALIMMDVQVWPE